MTILRVRHLTKTFGALRALDGISFDVEEGEIFGVAGPNGSGKSTLFNAITGIPFGPDAGQVLFGGRDLRGLRGHDIARLGLARTFQRETAFDSLSVFQNVLMGAGFAGRLSKRAAAARVDEAIEIVGFRPDQAGRPAAELSVFERKNLMLASALALAPRVLLLDEPASGLTKPEIEATIAIIRRIAARGMTILLIEHVLPLLLALSQRLMVMNQGTLLVLDAPDRVVSHPEVIRAYLGSGKGQS